jgi:putative iron-regulated protein
MKAAIRRGTLLALAALTYVGSASGQSVTAEAVARHYAVIVQASYQDTLVAARTMQRAINAFVAQPTVNTHEAAKQAWLAAREWYGQTEVFRFYGGPIDDAKGPEGRINSWPVDESYIDSVKDRPAAGIINNPKIAINRRQLTRLNQQRGEENVATGWHAIEFLLWGQDFNDDGPGNRSFEDFVDGKAANAKRRREYLRVVVQLLVDDLTYVAQAWQPNRKNYRALFIANGDEAVRRMLVGMGSLSRGELAGERLEVPLATQDQEDEQSCFSDNTHRDIVNNALGIENVWLGRYRRADGSLLQGASLKDLVAAKNPAVAQLTTDDIAVALAAANVIHAPFDQEIRGGSTAPGRLRVQALIDALKKQSKDLISSAEALGITRLTLTTPKKR